MDSSIESLKTKISWLNKEIGMALRESDTTKQEELLALATEGMQSTYNMLFAFLWKRHEYNTKETKEDIQSYLDKITYSNLMVR